MTNDYINMSNTRLIDNSLIDNNIDRKVLMFDEASKSLNNKSNTVEMTHLQLTF